MFLYLLLCAPGIRVAVLIFSRFSTGQTPDRGSSTTDHPWELLNPAVRPHLPVVIALASGSHRGGAWWFVAHGCSSRATCCCAALPVLRRYRLTAPPVTYIGKAATFALMSSGFPLVLLRPGRARCGPGGAGDRAEVTF